jgi:hypothetical protein
MFASILAFLVLVLPVVLTVVFVFIPDRKDKPMLHGLWRAGLITSAVLYSGLVWWQQRIANREAKSDRDSAIGETATRVAKETTENVTQALAKQYGSTISEMAKQLREQGANVDTIKQSNIVSGKKPLAVVVTNPAPPSSSGEPPLEVHVSRIPAMPNLQLGKNALQFILTTNRVMNGGHVQVHCDKGKINQAEQKIAGAGSVMSGGAGGLVDPNTFISNIESPNWAPDFPLLITLYFDDDDLGTCRFNPQ